MKIALVCPYDIAYHGGVQNQVMQFAQYAREFGHNVAVIAPSSNPGNSNGVFSAGKTIPIPIGNGTVARLTFSFWNTHKLSELLANGNFDVVHVNAPEAPILGPEALRYANTESSVLVTTSHSNITPNLVTWGYSTIGRALKISRLIDKAHVRVAVSPAAVKLAQHYLPGKYVVIPNGVDTEHFSPDIEPIPEYIDDKINILFVGRLGNNEKRKGLYYMVSAFNELHWEHPNTRLLIVGPGNPDRETRTLLEAIDNRDIVLAGGVPANELPRYYATAHIFAATPTDGESFSLVVAEAMASGKPVVTTNIPGPRDVLLGFRKYGSEVSGSNFFVAEAGILVPPRNPPATAAALERLVLDEAARIGMGQKGRWIVAENFSWDVVAPQILQLYQQLINEKKETIVNVSAAAGTFNAPALKCSERSEAV